MRIVLNERTAAPICRRRSSSADKGLYRRPANWESANSPFTIRWESGASPRGGVRLVLSGYFADSTPVDKVIEFYNRPGLKGAAAARP